MAKKNIKKKSTKKEKVCETFEVGKKGKEKTIKSCGVEEVKISNKGQIEHQNKILGNILIIIGAFVFVFILGYLISYSMTNFEFRGVNYNLIKEKDITFYHTILPSPYYKPGMITNFNIYLRNDPRELNKVSFEGKINLMEMAVISINKNDNFDCDGDGVIAVYNFNQVLRAMGTNVVQDENYSFCDTENRYNYFELKNGNETKVVQTSPTCYDIIINDCKVLEGTERFLIEALAKIN
ncbi:MAG: hypothetical protein OQK82_03140 [Candidatus Pacearchaeota archaeon]|nr:hypothetical protein [Candidatus Pacearchaeota archaeon]